MLVLTTTVFYSQLHTMDKPSDTTTALNAQLAHVFSYTFDCQEAERLINQGAHVTSLPSTPPGYIISNLKMEGYYAHERGEQPNKYYMALRIIKKYAPWLLGMPYDGSLFGDSVLDEDMF